MATDEAKADDLDPDELDPQEETPERLNLTVKIASPSACERHLTITVPREDINRYYEEAYSELMPTAEVAGFRSGRAPRKLVEQRYKDEITAQIKRSLLVDSMTQVTEEEDVTPISEPDFDVDAIEVPDDGPLTFEFNLEVRPEFDVPDWQGMSLERLSKEITDSDVEQRLEAMLSRLGQLRPTDDPAQTGDYLVTNIVASFDGRRLAAATDEQVRVQEVLSFVDGKLEEFDKLMEGVKAGETRDAKLKLTDDAPNEELRGKQVDVSIEVLDVKRLELPCLTAELLDDVGGFESEEELREAVRMDLERQAQYRQQQQARRQITAELTASANWDLPPSMLRRQSERELERAVLELRRAGFSEDEILARENELRQNSAASTSRALKEHFILERIAEDEGVDVEPGDYDAEIQLIASQSGQSVRRVRAQLEKSGMMDALRNQILERKTLDLVLDQAKFKDVRTAEVTDPSTSAIAWAAGGGLTAQEIPDAAGDGTAVSAGGDEESA